MRVYKDIHAMICPCGYSFARAALEKPRPYKSFALIDDQQYGRFLRAETKAVVSKDLGDLAKAARYVGTLKICPECGIVNVSWPDDKTPVSHLAPTTSRGKKGKPTVTPSAFQKLALSYPEATEEPHFEKTSFRVRKKIFATMAPEKGEAVVKLTPLDQEVFVANSKGAMHPVKGKWGEQGWTTIALKIATKQLVNDILTSAYCTVAPRKLAEQVPRT